MANTYTLIASSTVGSGGAASIDFTSIPSTYTDLCLVASMRTTYSGSSDEQIKIQYNGSTTGYSDRILYAYGGTNKGSATRTGATGTDDFSAVAAGATASTFSNNQLYIPNYAGSNYKSYSYDVTDESNSSTQGWMDLGAGLWSNTAAITSIKLSTIQSGSLFVQYSTAYLYGVKNA